MKKKIEDISNVEIIYNSSLKDLIKEEKSKKQGNRKLYSSFKEYSKEEIDTAVSKLPLNKKNFINDYYNEELTNEIIAQKYNIKEIQQYIKIAEEAADSAEFYASDAKATVDNLNAVIIERIVRCSYHNSAIKFVLTGYIGNAGRGGYMEHISIRTGGGYACGNGVFQHIA